MTHSIIQKSKLEGAHRLDAEYYQPEYLEVNQKLINQPKLSELAGNIICGPFGSAILNSDYQQKGIPLLRVNNLNNDFVNCDDLVFIDNILSNKLERYQIEQNDLVVSQRGTVAMFSLVGDEYSKYNISANLISISNPKKINFLYLLAFLNSRFGNKQLTRSISGQVQEKITTDDIKNILVYLPNRKIQNKIADLVNKSKQELKSSKSLYSQAENLLLEELGLKDFEEKSGLSYIVNLSETKEAYRIDAEYFQEKYKKLEGEIKKNKVKNLGELVEMKKGREPGSDVYEENGKPFIRVSNLSKLGINNNNQKYLLEKLYQKLRNNFEPQTGEILLTKDATPGIAWMVKGQIEGIISSGILRLKLKEKIEPEYLVLVINSIVGQMQAERDTGGSVIVHWRPEQIKNIIVPVLPKDKQKIISDLIKKSFVARNRAKELLEEAKSKVEEMIENN